MSDLKEGEVIVYTGGGKGKTTASLGLALRAIGYHKKVCMVQFIKGTWFTGEINAIKRLSPDFELVRTGKGFIKILDDKSPFTVHKKAAKEAIQIAKEKITSGKYDVVILDEINYALHGKLIRLKDVVGLINSRPIKTTLVLTGNFAHPRIIKLADLATEMRKIKHPYDKGLLAKPGIDF